MCKIILLTVLLYLAPPREIRSHALPRQTPYFVDLP